MINLTVVIDNDEAIRKFRELQQVAKSTTSSMVTDADRMDAAMHRFGMTMGKVGVAAALAGLVKQIAQTRGEFQQLEVAFTTLLQSKEKADALMSQMVDLAAKTPFDLQGVASGARQLLAYGFAADDITDTLTRLGNVAAGLGLPLERLTYLYGTTAVQGRVYARDMLQFTGSGIPMLQEMAKMYGKTTEEINAMVSAGKIGFSDVKKVIENMTNEGGQFHNLMQEQSKTISGLISNLGDAIDTMFNDIGKSSEGMIAGVLQGTISLVENYEKVLDILIPLVATYGAYKAALIVTAALQKVVVAFETTQAILEQTKMLTRATQAQILFNKAVKANPYVLAASAIVGIVTALAVFAKKAKTTEEIVTDLDAATNEYISSSTNISKLADEYENLTPKVLKTKEENDRLKEVISQLASVVPNAASQFDEYGRVLDINIGKVRQFSEAQKEALRLDVTQQITTAKNRLTEVDKELQKEQAIFQGKKIQRYGYKKGEDGSNQYGLVDIPATEEQIAASAKRANELYAEREQLTASITRGEEVLQGITVKKTKDQPNQTVASFTDQLKNARLELSTFKQELSDLRSGKLPSGANADFDFAKAIEDKNKQIKEAQDKVNTLTGYDPKQTKKDFKSQKELSDAILANDLALQQSRIDILAEGKEKELQQIELDHEKAVQQIEKSRRDLIAKNGGKPLSKEQEDSFTEQLKNTNKATDSQRIAVKLKYAKQLEDIYKQITDSSLSEIDRESRGIKEKYQELRDTVTRLLEGGSISKEKATEWFGMIDQNEIADNLEAVVNKYGSAEDKITKIQKEAAAARAKATENNRTDLIPQITKQEQQDIGKVKVDELMKTDDWINLFQNLDALSSKEIYRIIDNINEQLKNANLDPINFKTVTDQLEQAQEKAITKNPFSAIVHSFKDYKTAQEKAIGLQNKYNETQDKADKENADQASLEAIRKKQQAWQSVVSTIGEMGQALGATSDLLGQFGVESAELDGVVKAMNSIASIDVTRPFSVVTGIIGGISSLIGGIFNGKDRRAQKRIERLQNQVDALQKSYEKLDRAINKAYSSDAKELIEDQNKMLQQQKILIQQQIREEQSKKKTDHDQIKQWQDQIDEINNTIEDNVAKAQDAIFGSDVKSAISDFADAYAEAWASGEDRAAASKDFVKNMIKQMIVEAMKMDIAAPMQKVRDMLETFWADKIITPSEEEIINQMVGDIGSQLDGKYSWADKYLKNEDDSSQDASSKGFQTMSQETGEELNGRFTAIQEYTANIRDTVTSILLQGGQQLNETINIRDVAIQLNGNVAIIKGHTSHLEEMDNKLGKMVKIMNEKL